MNQERLVKIIELLGETNVLISEMAVELTMMNFDLTDQLSWDISTKIRYLANLSESGITICKEMEKFTGLLIDEIPPVKNT